MVAGLVAISVGDELVITHPAGHIRSAWIAVILGGHRRPTDGYLCLALPQRSEGGC